MRIEVLASAGCPHGAPTRALVAAIAAALAPDAEVVTVEVSTLEDAERLAFPGSPTVRVDGLDVDPCPAPGVGLG